MDQEKLKEYFDIYTDCWKFFKRYSDVEYSDQYWLGLMQEANNIYERHKTELCKKLILDTLDELERISKK